MVLTLSQTHVHKNAVNRVRVSWLLSGVPAAVECNSLSISYFLIIGCVVLCTLKCVTACVAGVYVSWSCLVLKKVYQGMVTFIQPKVYRAIRRVQGKMLREYFSGVPVENLSRRYGYAIPKIKQLASICQKKPKPNSPETQRKTPGNKPARPSIYTTMFALIKVSAT